MSDVRLNLHSPLAAFVRGTPVTALPDATVREVTDLMMAHKTGSVIIVEPESRRPIGIFTLRDLLVRVVGQGLDLDTMIVSVMTDSDLLILHWRATAYQAEMIMSRHGIHHVIVVDATGKLAGVVSQDTILDLQRGGMKAISNTIRNARDMAGLVAAAADIRRVAKQMVSEGSGAEALTQTISTLNDHLTVRVLELTQREFALPRIEWCWLAFGSEGRYEQTLSTDQDNGIILKAPRDQGDALRAEFLPFAAEVNRRLDACGFPLCEGNIMAGNPELCLTLAEWQDRFAEWMRCANPEALLKATIFFDFRALFGSDELADDLRHWLLQSIPPETAFQRLMADNAVRAKPPLGLIRDFVFGDKSHTLDLKAYGTRPFVDAARILALAAGIGETSTAERLRALKRSGKLGSEDVNAMIEGFYFIQQLRLRNQDGGGSNHIDPDDLNELDRAVLKMAFKQAKKLQDKLQLDYRL